LIGVICCMLAVIPLGMTLANLFEYRVPPRTDARRGDPRQTRPAACVSVLIPARNEAQNILAACAAVLASTGVDLELIVADDGSEDGTLELLQGIEDPRFRAVVAPPLPSGWCGKQHACNHLGALARHECLVFIDADVRITPDALDRLAGFMQRERCALASGVPRQVLITWSEQLLLPLIHFLLLGYLPMARMRRSLDPGLGAACGQLIAVSREAYRAVGGHAAIASRLHDGLALPRAFRRAGYATRLIDATPIAHCRMYTNVRQVWEGLCKNATEGMATPVGLPLWTLLLGGGQVLPAVLLITYPSPLALTAVCGGILTRFILAWRFGQPILSCVVHPAGVAMLLAIQWFSLARAQFGGASSWRGRRYAAH
jgi:GT2 family glycosyltransferase